VGKKRKTDTSTNETADTQRGAHISFGTPMQQNKEDHQENNTTKLLPLPETKCSEDPKINQLFGAIRKGSLFEIGECLKTADVNARDSAVRMLKKPIDLR
jgi:hypothetical protein